MSYWVVDGWVRCVQFLFVCLCVFVYRTPCRRPSCMTGLVSTDDRFMCHGAVETGSSRGQRHQFLG